MRIYNVGECPVHLGLLSSPPLQHHLLQISEHQYSNLITIFESSLLYIIIIMFIKTLLTVAAAVSAVHAAPTGTTTSYPSKTVSLTGVTHTVASGRGGLHFEPNNIVAEIGDVVEWHFLPKNHSVVQSSFGEPCKPLDGNQGFFSGFFPIAEGQSTEVFQIVVENKTPIWFYCGQTTGNHCQNGMVGAINQNFDGPNTLSKFTQLAAGTGVSTVPPYIQGGSRIPNPNPLAGV
jgi:plastocyanin